METWPYIPQRGHTEALEWLTDVFRARSQEYRHSLRQSPRTEWMHKYLLEQSEYGKAKALARKIGIDALYLPLWSQAAEHANVAAGGRVLTVDCRENDFRLPAENGGGGYVFVWSSNTTWQLCEILTLTTSDSISWTLTTTEATAFATAHTRPMVMPVASATFSQDFYADRSTDDMVSCGASFLATSTEDLGEETGLTYAEHRTYPVITDPAILVGSIKDSFGLSADIIDSETGILTSIPLHSGPGSDTAIAWRTLTRDALWDLRVFLHQQRGQWKAFWLPSWNADATIDRAIDSADTTIRIAACDFVANVTLPVDLCVVTTAGIFHFCRATGAGGGGAGHELLTLDAAFGATVALENISLACLMTLSRFKADRFELQYGDGGVVTVSAPVTEVPL
jgi:hypothetical protein